MESILHHQPNSQEPIRRLTETPQDVISNLSQQVSTQTKMIEFLLEQYNQMKKRNLELIEANNEIRDLMKAYVIIVRNLSKRDNLSQTERDLLRSFEQVHVLLRTAKTQQDKDETVETSDSIANFLYSEAPQKRLLAKKKFTQSHELSNFEIPTITNAGNPLSDVTVIKRRSSFKKVSTSIENITEENPNMETLLQFPLFSLLPEAVMERIASSCYEIRKKAGQIVVNKGEEAAEIFFLLEGTVAVELDEKRRTHLKTGSFFGELGVLFKFKRTATVTAITDCALLVVMKQRMDEAISSNAELIKIVEEFAANKEAWWKGQKYVSSQASFGAEFAHDIARKDIRKLPIFASASERFIQSLAMKTKGFVAEENEVIVSIGEESDAIYFILSGVLEVVGANGAIHAEMTDGAFFGEVGVILELKRTASIRAKVKSHIFRLNKSDLDDVISEFPAMAEALEDAASERYALFMQRSKADETVPTVDKKHVPDQFDIEIGSQSLSKLSIFHGVDSSLVAQLSMKMIRKTWNVDEIIIKCGDIGDGMFFLAAGDADVIAENGDVVDEVSGPSAYFGEVALLEHIPRTATVQCTTVCSTYELKQKDFLAVMERFPEIAAKFKETADSRMQKHILRSSIVA